MNEVFLDTETTGLSFKDGHKIVEIACIETKDLVPTKNIFHELINPQRSVPEEAYNVHGFSTEFLKQKPNGSLEYSKNETPIIVNPLEYGKK